MSTPASRTGTHPHTPAGDTAMDRAEIDALIDNAREQARAAEHGAFEHATATRTYRETRTEYRVNTSVVRDGVRYSITKVEILRADSRDPDDPEPYVAVSAAARPLKADGTPDNRYGSRWIHLPADLADVIERQAA